MKPDNTTPQATYVDHDKLLSRLSERPPLHRAYSLAAPRFAIIRDIINLRHAHGLTQGDLARRTGTHQSRISKVESGEHDIRLATLVQIADALDADVEICLVPRSTSKLFSKLFVQRLSTGSETLDIATSPDRAAGHVTIRS